MPWHFPLKNYGQSSVFSSLELFWLPVVRRPSENFYIFHFFSRTTGPILTRIDTNPNEEECPSPRGDDSKRVKLHWTVIKIFFSRTSKPVSINYR
jgi:hypothetical protein